MAQTAKTSTIFVPEPGVYVQTAATPEHPGGDVVFLPPGWQDVEPAVAENAIVKRLAPADEEAAKRARDASDAVRERATNKAQVLSDYYTKAIGLDDANNEAMRLAEEERGKRVDAEIEKGNATPREDPVDPIALSSITLTMTPDQHMMVSAAGMGSKHPWETPGNPNGAVPTAAPENVDVPNVTGDGTVGSVLNCTMGNWNNMDSGTYAYAWTSDGAATSATGANYNVAAGDVGKSVACIVTATNALGSTAAPSSNTVVITEGGGATRGGRRTTV